MTQSDSQHTTATINASLREVLAGYVGQPVALGVHDYGAKKRSGLEGTITEATAGGVLLTRAHGGREYVSYSDLFAGHIEITAPGPLAEDLGDALAHLGVQRRQHGSDGGRGKARLPVGPAREGFHHVKRLVG